jgi:putative transposase
MPDFRRAYVPGGSFFFTLVTHSRRRFLTRPLARTLLGDILRQCQSDRPFEINAIVLLPDHLHTIWTLPPGDMEYSARWAWIKREFSSRFLKAGGKETAVSKSRGQERRRGIWQPRFWEHTLETVDDFERHLDYIHYNPVKHRLVKRPCDWQWSSFQRWMNAGVYDTNWACGGCALSTHLTNLSHDAGEPVDQDVRQ